MKTLGRLKIIAIILLVIVLILASFFGVFKKEDFRVVNIVKDYKLGMHFTDKLLITGVIGDGSSGIIEYEYTEEESEEEGEEKTTTQEGLDLENAMLTKKIIKKRLKGMGIGEYNLNLDEKTGNITIEVQNNDEAHEVSEHAVQKGVFKIIDKDTEEILLTNKEVKSTKVVYGASQKDATATVVYLQINFDKEGAKKLEEISQIYVEKTEDKEAESEDETLEAEQTGQEDSTKYISVLLDDETLSSTFFGEKMSTGVLYIPITQATDSKTLTNYIKEVSNMSTIINSGELPLEYTFTNKIVESDVNQKNLIIGIAIPAGILLVLCIILIIKFRLNGLISTFLQIGYIALLLLLIRYTNVIITIQSIVGIVVFAFINYIFNYLMLKNIKEKGKMEWNMVGKFALYTCPIYVLAIILAFNSLTIISSLGMAAVWGSFTLYIYNLTITKNALETLKK